MENKVKDQIVTDRYAIYNSDCMLVMPTLPDESVLIYQYIHHRSQDCIIIHQANTICLIVKAKNNF
jgi:hypothetical protein